MKVATWNVNSLRIRLAHVLDWLAANRPDVLALQETKVSDEQFPVQTFIDAGYHAIYSGQKAYNGVAILCRMPLRDVVRDVSGLDDPQRRTLAATVSEGDSELRILNVYVPNGSQVGSEKYAYKLDWLNRIVAHVGDELATHKHFVMLGDFNIAPADADVHDPDLWFEKILCSTLEREALKKFMALGLVDTFRQFEQVEKSYSWWDYRAAGFRRNQGLRIDIILASPALSQTCSSCHIDKSPRGLERPSDHAPVIAEFGGVQAHAP
ncbi:MAG: exodeoxyribonuclease III [Gammaproteobacteria bacterium]|nr:exodeoxyribonuclease III [Gammaproteobacteria bacterium]